MVHAYRNSVLLLLLAIALPAIGQQVYPTPGTNDETGFERIFDGKTLNGWEGDPKYWRVESGCLVGEVTPDTLLKQNSFIIWRGGTTRDFELKVEYRISAKGNSGINYRSVQITNSAFALRGYQSDIDGANKYTGQNYEEKGRTFLALRGDISRVDADGKSRIIGSVGDKDALPAFTTVVLPPARLRRNSRQPSRTRTGTKFTSSFAATP